MKKTLCAALLLAFAFTVSAPQTVCAEERQSLAVLGDSIATGFGLEGYVPGDNGSAADSFGNMLSREYAEYSNFAKDGMTGAELLEAIKEEDIAKALSGADTVIISIGGNDFLSPMGEALSASFKEHPEYLLMLKSDPEALAERLLPSITEAVDTVDLKSSGENFDMILKSIKELNPDCRVFILTVYDPFGGNTATAPLEEIAESKLGLLNGEIYAAAEKNGAYAVDIYSAFNGNAGKYTNIRMLDIHPSKEGHDLIFNELKKAGAGGGLTTSAPETGNKEARAFAAIMLLSGAAAICFGKKAPLRGLV